MPPYGFDCCGYSCYIRQSDGTYKPVVLNEVNSLEVPGDTMYDDEFKERFSEGMNLVFTLRDRDAKNLAKYVRTEINHIRRIRRRFIRAKEKARRNILKHGNKDT